jgi:hypothetical protein
MRQSGLLQMLYKKNFPHSFVEEGHDFSSVSLSQVTPIAAVLATGIMAAILALTYERRFTRRWRGRF